MAGIFTLATENGTNGNDATEALTGYTLISNQVPKYSNAWAIAGSLSLQTVATGNASICRKEFAESTSVYVRRYMKVTSLPSANCGFMVVLDSAGVHLGDLRMTTTGTIQLRNAGSSTVGTSSHAFAAGDVFRVEYNPVVAGTSTVRLFWGSNINGTTADEVLTGTNGTAGTGQIQRLQEGVINGVTWTVAWDETAIDDSTWVGPIGGGGSSAVGDTATLRHKTRAAVSDSVSLVWNSGSTPELEVLIYDSGVWVPAEVMIRDAGAWVPARYQRWDGDEVAAGQANALTGTAGWYWAGYGYQYGPGTYAVESGGLRASWDPTPAQVGNGYQAAAFLFDLDAFPEGHRLRLEFVVSVPSGSPDVQLVQLFGHWGNVSAVKDTDVTLELEVVWTAASQAFFGVQAAQQNPTSGSVLIKEIHVYDQDSAPLFGVWVPADSAPGDVSPPTQPGTISGSNIGPNSITFTWGASTDNVGVAGYRIRLNSGSWVSGVASPYAYGGLSPSTAYTPEVQAYDAAGNYSTIRTGSPVNTSASSDTTPPTQPGTISSSNVGSTQITFSWGASTDNVAVTGYEIRLNSGAWVDAGNNTSRQMTGLSPSTSYTPDVRAYDAAGNRSTVRSGSATSTSAAPTGEMFLGAQWIVPTASDVNNNPELAAYTGVSRMDSLKIMEAEQKALSGWSDEPLHRMGHSFFNGTHNYNAMGDSWCSTQMARYPSMTINFKPNGGVSVANANKLANGQEDSLLASMMASFPSNKRIYLCYYHEPNWTTASDVAAWRAANAHFAKYILDHRGAKDIHPAVCLTTWSFRPANATVQNRYLQVTDDYEALGVDWVSDVVMSPDGYQDKAAAVANAAETYENVFPVLYDLGWRRFGINEVATGTKVGMSGDNNVTAADVAASDDWLKSLLVYADQWGLEFICYFYTTGSKGPIGSWMYTNAIKKVWADACHYRGPAPGW